VVTQLTIEGNDNMEISIPGKVIVFDYGEVISIVPSDADRARLTELAGDDSPAFWESYWRHREPLDQGTITVRQYWRQIEMDLGKNWDTARIHALWLTDFRGWLAIDNGTLDVLIDLQNGGTRMALLSNAGRDFASYYRHGMLGDFFEEVFVSGELGTLKPGADIFQAALAGLNIPAHEMIFIDNREENIRGAEALGIVGHVFTDAVNLRSYLEGIAAQTSADGPSSSRVKADGRRGI
jgi:putative hydrolase of the HAD superfamily